LDIGASDAIRRQILGQKDEGHAILLISMDLDEIMMMADTIGIMFNGSMAHIAPASDMTIDVIGEYMMGLTGDGQITEHMIELT
jgi:simple sugar transport system ATP-binding protein